MSDVKYTPLYSLHQKCGARIEPFAGWAMPIQYTGIIEEHNSVRTSCGVFDVSHMGEIRVKGKKASVFLQQMLTNDIVKGYIGRVIYSPMCNPEGGVIDDMTVYCLGNEEYMLVVNASRTEIDFRWLSERAGDGVNVEDISLRLAEIALQGPASASVLQKIWPKCMELRYYHFERYRAGEKEVIVSRTGYTGEDGYEIYCDWEDAPELWETLMDAGADEGITPCGLGCRDTLRLEAGMPLYGHELDESHTPIEAGLERFVCTDKGDFVGAASLKEQLASGTRVRLCGFQMIEPGIARAGYRVLDGGKVIGVVTSGSHSPTLGKAIGMAYVESELAVPGKRIDIDLRGRVRTAEIVKLPFYKRHKK
ncbi:MAG TPA: glycine cleavage system aminomethyltransferase GcvT [Firmicutes bacterium]|nr:glycine cleavage system aminomethyltransferase GcvT [Bacillota bacterium]